MEFNIQASGFTLTDGLRQHTERRLRFALGWAGNDLRKVAVRLSDINGPRGGIDKRCKIQILLTGRKEVVIEDTEADLYVAIDRVAERADRAVARQLQRLREHHHDRLHVAEPAGDGGPNDASVSNDEAPHEKSFLKHKEDQ